MKEKFEGHRDAAAKGGSISSQKTYYCALCDEVGTGPRYKQHHIDTGNCGGIGVKNYWSRVRRNRSNSLDL